MLIWIATSSRLSEKISVFPGTSLISSLKRFK